MEEPLESGLSLERAEEKYKEVRDKFERVKSHYSGLLSIFGKDIKESDYRSLTDCIGVLLPLGMENLVQRQTRQTEKYQETLHYKIWELHRQVLEYLADFRNSGVERLENISLDNFP